MRLRFVRDILYQVDVYSRTQIGISFSLPRIIIERFNRTTDPISWSPAAICFVGSRQESEKRHQSLAAVCSPVPLVLATPRRWSAAISRRLGQTPSNRWWKQSQNIFMAGGGGHNGMAIVFYSCCWFATYEQIQFEICLLHCWSL
jgi:hypothetical protein